MAHADYACCIVCDRKMYYSSDSYAKCEICPACASGIAIKSGQVIRDVYDFLQWFRNEENLDVIEVLDSLGYKPCFYGNEFDQRVKSIKDLKS